MDSHDLESLFDWSKGFQDWLETGICPNFVAFNFFCLVLKGSVVIHQTLQRKHGTEFTFYFMVN